MEKRIIVTGSQTSAIKAVRLLESKGVHARTARAAKDPSKGCRFGAQVSFKDLSLAMSLLSGAGINYSEITI